MDNLSLRIDRYIHLCRQRLQPLLDRQPWSEIAVNPAPEFRAVFAETEASGEFLEAARAFDAFVGEESDDSNLAFEGPSRCRHYWHLRAFLWNAGVYDNLIRSQPVNGDQVVEMISREVGRTDIVFTHAALLEGFGCQAEIDAGGFNIRHLTHQEIREVFAGRSGLDRRYTESAIQEDLRAEWFAVVRGPARPLEVRIVFDDTIGLHDFSCTPFRDINLGLNLFKAAPGPVIIRQAFHWNSSLFHRRVREYPRQSNDLFPSSWGGPDDPLPMRLYRLDANDGRRLPLFWNEFKQTYIDNVQLLPSYIHRAVDRFLRACQEQRTDWEFRQLLYVMALEALFSGEDEESVRPKIGVNPKTKKPILLGVKDTVAECCANLPPSKQNCSWELCSWLRRIYSQRSRVAHGSRFEQEEFLAQPQCPGAHTEAESLCRLLKVDTSSVVEGPDIEFALLHNVTRMALLFSIGRAAEVLKGKECAEICQKLIEYDGPTKPSQLERQRLEDRLEQIHLDAKRALVKDLTDCLRRAKRLDQARKSSGFSVRWASTG
jgi:hypothetical protein